MRPTSARTRAWLLAIALSIGLVACGSSSYKNSSSATTVSGTATTAEADKPTPTSAPPVPAAVTNGKATIDVKVGTDDFTTTKGTSVTINLTATDAEDYHLHGYDIEQKADPGKTSTFEFTADQTGQFDLESHVTNNTFLVLVVT